MAFIETSSLPLEHHHIDTAHGALHLSSLTPPNTSKTSPLTLLHIHGNSSCTLSFHRLLTHACTQSSPITAHRTLLLELPGHGASTNAPDPESSYTQPSYAAAALDALHALGHLAPQTDNGGIVVLGWSLGGHVALELVAADRWIKGVMIVGTPPALGAAQVDAAFLNEAPRRKADRSQTQIQTPHAHARREGEGEGERDDNKEDDDDDDDGTQMQLAELQTWPAAAFDTFPYAAIGAPHDAWIRDAALRTDGRARRVMFDAFKGGRGVDQRRLCAESDVPIAVVNSGAEPFVNLDYLDAVQYKKLWEERAYRIEGLGHAPFWEQPDLFLPFWERFVGFCEDAKRS